MKIYVDGQLDNSVARTGNIGTGDGTTSLYFGRYTNPSTNANLNGNLDDVKIYSTARTAAQILNDYNNTLSNGTSINIASAAVGTSNPSTSFATEETTPGPIAYWKFDEGYGTTANNVGNGGSTLNGSLSGMASPATATSGWTNSGKFGKALVFDGTNDYVNIGNPTSLQITGNITLSAWVKLSAIGKYHMIVTKSPGNSASGYELEINSSNKIRFLVGSYPSAEVNGSTALTTDTWYHITGVYDGATMKVYLNGKQDGSTNWTTNPPTNSENVLIGQRADLNGSYATQGQIDDPKIFNYALTPTQVKILYNGDAAFRIGPTSGTP